jgi:hypothetical protein
LHGHLCGSYLALRFGKAATGDVNWFYGVCIADVDFIVGDLDQWAVFKGQGMDGGSFVTGISVLNAKGKKFRKRQVPDCMRVDAGIGRCSSGRGII